LSSGELLKYVGTIEARFSPFYKSRSDTGNMFDTVPVLRPVMKTSPVSRGFGMALDPFSGKRSYHYGIDLVAEPGSPVVATASGVIQRVEKHPLWGKKIVIAHCASYMTTYSHLGEVKTSQGKRVKRGETIGTMGLSGLSSGPHIHYEVWHNGKLDDPEKYFFPEELVAK
jgi:murein DD-endopeptidase MepM/ murein hydrolase activator NlpD